MYMPSSFEGPKGNPTGFQICVTAHRIRGIINNNNDGP
jgi:hypothetical protein